MSHVLGLLARAPGKYELKYKLSTLIEPFAKQRTSSWAASSGEIARLFSFPQNLRELTRPEMACRLGDRGLRGSTQTQLALRGCSCLDQFLLYDCSRQLTIRTRGSSDGSQEEFQKVCKVRGGAAMWFWGTRGRSSVSQRKGSSRDEVWSGCFLIWLAGYCICKCCTEGREVVINGSSVLGFFCEAVQGLTGLSMRFAHARGQESRMILPRTPASDIISLLGAPFE